MILENNIGKVHSIETFGAVDGPGIRYIIFLTGCKFRCLYCHNPDTWFSGKDMSVDSIIEDALKYKSFWKNDGGITISGGEPLLQLDFVNSLFKKAKEKDINTCIETSGGLDLSSTSRIDTFKNILKNTNTVIFDIKGANNELFKKVTIQDNTESMSALDIIDSSNIDLWIRYVLVPGLTDDINDIYNLKEIINLLNRVKKVEVLPYHTLGVSKYKELGIKYSLLETEVPSTESLNKAKAILGDINGR